MKKPTSWRTTGSGLAAILLVIGAALNALTDNDPLTQPDWPALLAAITAGVGLIYARDHVVTSEQAGAKAEPRKGTGPTTNADGPASTLT